MTLLVDLFGYLSIVIHGLTIAAQSMLLGGVLFLVLLARPCGWLLGPAGQRIAGDSARLAAWAAFGLVLAEAATVAMQAAVLMATVGLPLDNVLQAGFALAGLVKIGMALLMAAVLVGFGARAPGWLLLPLGAVELAAATMTTHAAARLTGSEPLLAISALHQFGAAIWIGGIPCFLLALRRVNEAAAWEVIGRRFSRMSMVGVGCIALSGAGLAYAYVGDLAGFYGTAYGVMVGAKIAMFAALLLLGLGNFHAVRRLRRRDSRDISRLRRFAEVEIGVGLTLFFAAASLTSVPPAVDLPTDRVTFQEIVARNTPQWPRLESPDRDMLTLPALQAKLDAEAARQGTRPPAAFVPGSGELPDINAADIAWSEYNHHWAGIFVLAIGFLALLNRAGLRMARHWPLLFLGLAGFLFFRSDPESWPLGAVPFLDSLRDVEVLQHRFFVVLIVVFGVFEWRVRLRDQREGWQPLVFPLACALGGAALLTHSHAIANVKQQLLVEITHTPLALAGVAAGWTRWLELRLQPPAGRVAGWIWPVCLLFVGALLLLYREA